MSPAQLNTFLRDTGLSNAQLAELLGVTEGAVEHWLTGARSMQPTAIKCVLFFRKHPEMMHEFAFAGVS